MRISFFLLFAIICVTSFIFEAYAEETEAEGYSVAKVPEMKFKIDDFERNEILNYLNGKANVYVMAPSRIMVSVREDVYQGEKTQVLMLKYDKKNEGGPYETGGWCGYYSLLKDEKKGEYFDASRFKYLTFLVKGTKGDENFKVGVADRHWDKIGDSLKSEPIGKYLPVGKVTADWQIARIPLDVYFLDYTRLSSIAICFEGDCFPNGAGSGTVYLDNVAFE